MDKIGASREKNWKHPFSQGESFEEKGRNGSGAPSIRFAFPKVQVD